MLFKDYKKSLMSYDELHQKVMEILPQMVEALNAIDKADVDKFIKTRDEFKEKLGMTDNEFGWMFVEQKGYIFESPDCYSCKFRGTVAGDTHSSCSSKECLVSVDPHGLKMGWAFHPFNFDPIWIKACTGFKPKTIKEKEENPS